MYCIGFVLQGVGVDLFLWFIVNEVIVELIFICECWVNMKVFLICVVILLDELYFLFGMVLKFLYEFSVGMCQCVVIVCLFVLELKVFIVDEVFVNLDFEVWLVVFDVIIWWWKEQLMVVFFVINDVDFICELNVEMFMFCGGYVVVCGVGKDLFWVFNVELDLWC